MIQTSMDTAGRPWALARLRPEMRPGAGRLIRLSPRADWDIHVRTTLNFLKGQPNTPEGLYTSYHLKDSSAEAREDQLHYPNEEEISASPSKGLDEWFPAHHPKTDNEQTTLVRDALIALDANVLLDLYRYIPATRNELINALRLTGSRLWVPHQAAKEFHDRRFTAIANQEKAFGDALAAMQGARNTIRQNLERLQQSCSIPESEFAEEYASADKAIESIEKKAVQQQRKVDVDIESAKTGDHLLKALTELLRNKVGPPLPKEQLSELYAEGESRYKEEIPPGFEDVGKDHPAKFGDLILWKQLIIEARRRNMPVLLVSREQKRDWVRRREAHVLGPHPLLVEEFQEQVGQIFHIIQPVDFLRLATDALQASVSNATFAAVNSPQRRNENSQEIAEEAAAFSNMLQGLELSREKVDIWATKLLDAQTYLSKKKKESERVKRELREAAHARGGEIPDGDPLIQALDATETTSEDIERINIYSRELAKSRLNHMRRRTWAQDHLSKYSAAELRQILNEMGESESASLITLLTSTKEAPTDGKEYFRTVHRNADNEMLDG